jgi:acyl-CoA dehydrogenase
VGAERAQAFHHQRQCRRPTATVFAVTDKAKRARGGITAFIVEKTDPGFFVGTIERKMGMRGSHTCELIFDNCQVPGTAVIGGDAMIGQGFKTAMKTLDKGRLTMGASALGSHRSSWSFRWTTPSSGCSSASPLPSSRPSRIMLAEMATKIYAGRQMLYHAAWLRDKRAPR